MIENVHKGLNASLNMSVIRAYQAGSSSADLEAASLVTKAELVAANLDIDPSGVGSESTPICKGGFGDSQIER